MATPTQRTDNAITIRTGPRPGDLGVVLALHGTHYHREYGFDERFEGYVAAGLARFADALGAAREDQDRTPPGWLWVAERAGEPVGTIALTDEGNGTGQVRWYLVVPAARRAGVGGRLLRVLLDHARTHGFHRLILLTVDQLTAAARRYTEAGFAVADRQARHQWGHDLVEVRYELELTYSR